MSAEPLAGAGFTPLRVTGVERLTSDAVAITFDVPPELCGPFALVTDGRQALLDDGVDPARVHSELFHADAPPPRPPCADGQSADTSTVLAELHGRTTTLTVDRDGAPVLDALLAVRPDAPYACKGGVCGTCRARVLSGAVGMAVNYALEPDEIAAVVVLTCQARPTTPEVRFTYL